MKLSAIIAVVAASVALASPAAVRSPNLSHLTSSLLFLTNHQNRSVSIDPSRRSGMRMEPPQRFLASSVLAMAFLGSANAYVSTVEE